MNSRERVIAAIEHREPDRVPVDLGSTIMSGIMASALDRLRRHLGLAERPVRVTDVYQMLGEVTGDVIDRYGVDTLPVEPLAMFFDIPRTDWKPWTLFDGTRVLVPGAFAVEEDDAGRLLLHEGGDPSRPVAAVMPAGGYYFDRADSMSFDMDFAPPPLAEKEAQYSALMPSEKLDWLAREAERLRPTGKALVLGTWGDFGPPQTGNIPNWLFVLASMPDYVERLFEIKIDCDLRKLEQVEAALGDTIDVFGIDGADFGSQKAEMFSPDLFERHYRPYYTAINGWVHEHTSWKTWKHCCGSIPGFLPHLAASGLDCINPVQTSAAGMEPARLKRDFGDRITFWGGGVDTQRTLSFAAPEEVYREVAERVRVFAPGGGFVFNTVHNIQAGAPPENIDAMFQALRDRGTYPIETAPDSSARH